MRIYLAGAEHWAFILNAVEYPYRLASYYYTLKADNNRERVLRYMDDGSHWIMDSGLFSFMFGSEQGKLNGYEDYRSYTRDYVQALQGWGWKHALVESDVQKVLGVKETQKLREEFFHDCGMEVIYVWHLPDGEEGLRRMAREYKYIALSVPEIRLASANKRLFLLRLLRIIREEGDPKIHLLGNTENTLSRLPAFSGDSTTWKGAMRWGRATLYDLKDHQLRSVSQYSSKWKRYSAYCKERYPKPFKLIYEEFEGDLEKLTYHTDSAVAAISYRLFMEHLNGSE